MVKCNVSGRTKYNPERTTARAQTVIVGMCPIFQLKICLDIIVMKIIACGRPNYKKKRFC